MPIRPRTLLALTLAIVAPAGPSAGRRRSYPKLSGEAGERFAATARRLTGGSFDLRRAWEDLIAEETARDPLLAEARESYLKSRDGYGDWQARAYVE